MATTVIERECRICRITKPIDDYFRNTKGVDGFDSRCKICHRAANQSTYRKRIDYYREKHSAYNATDAYKASQRKHMSTQKFRESQKRARDKDNQLGKSPARYAIKRAIIEGRIPPAKTLKCDHCQGQAKEYHHHRGYTAEFHLDVIPLCVGCHKKADRLQRETQSDPA